MRTAGARQTAAPLVKFSLFALVTILATALLAATIINVSFAPKDTYRAVFSDVTGLEEGDDIRVAGVRVGEVEGIRIKDRTLAEVTFTVTAERPLLTSTGAVVRYRNLVGQRYIALTEGAGDGTRLRPGGTIPLSRTQPALDLNALLNGFKPLFAALSPNDVNQLATEIIKTLQGEGGTVNSLLAHTALLTTTLADRDELIGSVIDNLNSVLKTLDERGGRFSGLLKQLRRVISGLSTDRKPIGESLVSIGDLTEATSGLLDDARPPLKDDITELGELTGTLNRNEKTVEGVLKRLPNKLTELTGTASYGSWFNFYLCDFDGRIVLPKTEQVLTPEFHVARARCGA
ncbi:MCE family protein [Streptomyces ipomoeae]|uniref:Virulence factor, Mce family n=2 Tax=Streptomyces ipomoeae TaxID=103232 RepID=L1KYH4_9ACTN|nr:MlaD family protein [Streptomyces ipomoeae]EKX65851.1 virulence factor, Mce family [Streptomyces ipomoeae 91-03]MDX2696137.1 MlaD family protein [Streptomyces ipomoeae]MDX2839774.1 MlaD family protein [Streptomyces ipomoeae]TQE37993.1 MCE family protein [Streptomyces ipomoeae]TQE39871.1 MCE family protein [Streptomyces ipomoeae]